MTETLADHQVQCIGGTGICTSTERVLGHDVCDSDIGCLLASTDHTESEILGCKDTRDTVVIISDQDAVLALRSHKLRSFRDSGVWLDLQSLAGLEGENGARRGLSSVSSSVRDMLLLVEVTLNLSPDGLI
jgi:hypothetical protein